MDKTHIKVLVLGHNGMLGHIVHHFLKEKNLNIQTINHRFPSVEFIEEVSKSNANFLINCIGSIPQKGESGLNFIINNFLLPVFLSNYFNGRIIHPSSDCEDIKAKDLYAESKVKAFEYLKNKDKVNIIKCSIIGPELSSKKSLWEWLANNKEKSLPGYTNHFWNGITTLEWSKIAFKIIKGEITKKTLTVGTEKISKFNLLKILNNQLHLNKKILPKPSKIAIDRSVYSDLTVDDIEKQIKDLIIWYNK